jgi:hypothetical protein
MTTRIAKYAVLLIFAFGNIAFGAPPEPPGTEKANKIELKAESISVSQLDSVNRFSELTKNRAESLMTQAARTKLKIEAIYKTKIDSLSEILDISKGKTEKLLNQAMESLDTLKLPSYKEIIIDENGVIKARIDTGFITIDQSMIDSLLPDEIFDTTIGNRRQINSWGKNVVIDEDMRINSDIQVFRANVNVKGVVNGDVMTIGGDIYIAPTGVINGNAVAIGGKVKKDEGARVTGAIMQMRLPLMSAARSSAYQIILGVTILIVMLGLLFSWLAVALAPIPMGRISQQLLNNPFKSFAFGYICYISMPVIWVLLLVSVLGIPLALLGLPLVFPLVIVEAYAAINLAIGQRFFKKTNPIHAFLLGGLATTAAPLLLLIIGYLSNSLALFVINMIFLGLFLFIFIPFGIGAALLSRFGFPPRDKKLESASAQNS